MKGHLPFVVYAVLGCDLMSFFFPHLPPPPLAKVEEKLARKFVQFFFLFCVHNYVTILMVSR